MNARILCLVLPILLILTLVSSTFAQDAAADQAKALLKQGLDQVAAKNFKDAKASFLKVDASALGDADKKALEDNLGKLDESIKQQAAAREAYNDGEKALKAGDLNKAKDLYSSAANSAFLPDAEKKDATAQLAQVQQRLKANGTAPTPVPVAVNPTPAPLPPLTTTAPAEATGPLADMQAHRVQKAKDLVVEGKTALDQSQPDKAVDLFSRAAALDPNNAQAKTLLQQARAALAKQNDASADSTALNQMIRQREVLRQATLVEYDKLMKASNDTLRAANSNAEFETATDQARAAMRQIDDNKIAFGDPEYRAKQAEVTGQIKAIADRRDMWDRQRAAQELHEKDVIIQKRIAAQQEEKRRKIAELMARAKTLKHERKFQEAADVLDQVLQLDPNNCYAAEDAAFLKEIVMDRAEGEAFRTMTTEWHKHQIGIRDAEIPWYDLVRYPKDWVELSARREGQAAQSQSLDDADRMVYQKLKTKIPKLSFTKTPFKDVVDLFRQWSDANFHVNWQALTGPGVTQDTEVTLNLTNVSVQKALELVLNDLGTTAKLGYIVQGGVVTISSKDDLAKSPIIRVYDIRDLIVRVPNFTGPILSLSSVQNQGNSGCGSNSGIFGQCSSCGTGCCGNGEDNQIPKSELVNKIKDLIRTTIDKESWGAPTGSGPGSIDEIYGTLVVNQTAENHQALANLIEQLRETNNLQVSIEARFISVSSGFLNSIGVNMDAYFNIGSGLGGGLPGGATNPGGTQSYDIDPFTGAHVPHKGTSGWGAGKPGSEEFTPIGITRPWANSTNPIGFGNMVGVSTPISNGNSIGSQITAPAMSVAGTFLDDIQVDFIVQATQANSTTRVLTAPRITLFNGQRAYVTVGTVQAYVSSFDPVVGTNTTGLQPHISYIPTGSVLDVEATVSADRKYVTMTVRPQVSHLDALTPLENIGGGGRVQFPTVTLQTLMTTVQVPDKGTLLLGGQRLSAEVENEGGVPILSKIPVLDRFFTNRGKVRDEQTLLIMIKPTIIINKEQEEDAFPPTPTH